MSTPPRTVAASAAKRSRPPPDVPAGSACSPGIVDDRPVHVESPRPRATTISFRIGDMRRISGVRRVENARSTIHAVRIRTRRRSLEPDTDRMTPIECNGPGPRVGEGRSAHRAPRNVIAGPGGRVDRLREGRTGGRSDRWRAACGRTAHGPPLHDLPGLAGRLSIDGQASPWSISTLGPPSELRIRHGTHRSIPAARSPIVSTGGPSFVRHRVRTGCRPRPASTPALGCADGRRQRSRAAGRGMMLRAGAGLADGQACPHPERRGRRGARAEHEPEGEEEGGDDGEAERADGGGGRPADRARRAFRRGAREGVPRADRGARARDRGLRPPRPRAGPRGRDRPRRGRTDARRAGRGQGRRGHGGRSDHVRLPHLPRSPAGHGRGLRPPHPGRRGHRAREDGDHRIRGALSRPHPQPPRRPPHPRRARRAARPPRSRTAWRRSASGPRPRDR